ncbi:type IV pilin-like G/H family protein [Pantanalinema rosaneae CENA516]|uniref:type IV pilin-like G/H family protein n=1 Tax=Pantanalinema rosaneae TaxID=1620701 RepID=UPI003D6F7C9F
MRQGKLISLTGAIAILAIGCASPPSALETSQAARELAAREQVQSMLFDQQTHFLTANSFSGSLKKTDVAATPLETQSYRFKIQLHSGNPQRVSVTAIAKEPTLRSFTGAVFAMPSEQGKITISQICATTTPSTEPVPIPAAPTNLREEVKCPEGSRSLSALLAQRQGWRLE